MVLLSSRRSIMKAWTASASLPPQVRGLGFKARTSCSLMVEPPDTVRPALAFCHKARARASKSTPRWVKNLRSSAAKVARTSQGETSSRDTGRLTVSPSERTVRKARP
jgi:hypothetical protein